jgi:RNA polymerase sigma-70 factor (ECF subfamily)
MIETALRRETNVADEAAIRAAQNGDRAAFSALYEQHSRIVYNLVLRSTGNCEDANDICQEVWITVHRQLRALKEPAAFGIWLRRIASRACIDFSRRRHSRPEFTLEDFEGLAVEGEQGPEEAAVTRERAILAWEALGSLAPRQGIALFLREVEGLSYRDIAAALGSSVDAVETLLFRARGSLSRNFDSIETSAEKRCSKVRKVMSSVMDGETNRLAQLTAEAHLSACSSCQRVTGGMKRASLAYLGIPLIATTAKPALLASTATGGGVGLNGIAALIAHLKVGLVPLVAATAVATTGALAATVVAPNVLGLEKVDIAQQETTTTSPDPIPVNSSAGQQTTVSNISPASVNPLEAAPGAISTQSHGSVPFDTMPPATDAEAPPSGVTPDVEPLAESTNVVPSENLPLVPDVLDTLTSSLTALPEVQSLLPAIPPVSLPEIAVPNLPIVNQPLALPVPVLPPISVPALPQQQSPPQPGNPILPQIFLPAGTSPLQPQPAGLPSGGVTSVPLPPPSVPLPQPVLPPSGGVLPTGAIPQPPPLALP